MILAWTMLHAPAKTLFKKTNAFSPFPYFSFETFCCIAGSSLLFSHFFHSFHFITPAFFNNLNWFQLTLVKNISSYV
jgi:hypothetical protein